MNRFKIIFIGDSNVGKSSLCLQLVDNNFKPDVPSTIGAQFMNLKKNNNIYDIWDTAGQEKYRSIVTMYYRGTHIAILVYDISKYIDIDVLKKTIDDVNEKSETDTDYIIIGNKSDILSNDENMEKLNNVKLGLEKYKIPDNAFIMTSAMNNTGISELLHIIEEYCKQPVIVNTCEQIPDKKKEFFTFCNIL